MARKPSDKLLLSQDTRKKLYATRRTLPLSAQDDTGLRFKLEVYFKDPQVAKANPGTAIDPSFLVPWEPGLSDGPTSARFAVVDYDAQSGILEKPAKWDPTTNSYRSPSGEGLTTAKGRTSAQFRQVSVWGIVQHSLDFFEGGHGLGRRIGWGFEGNRLILVPTAGYGENAYYDRQSKSLQFYWFKRGDVRINTCESSDIVNHEFGHAVLDGLRPYYFESLLTETAAFHEFMGDLTALLMAFRNNGFREGVVKDSDGDLSKADLLASLAAQFGEAVTGQPYLRTALNSEKMADVQGAGPHTVSEVLTGTMFEIMVALLAKRRESQKRRFEEGKLKKVESMERLFWYTIDHMQKSAIQPLDFLPPCDVTFRDYALAVLRAEHVTNPVDPDGFREAMLQVFIKRGILGDADRTLLEPAPVFTRPELSIFPSIDAIGSSRGSAYRFLDDNRSDLLIPATSDVIVVDVAKANKLTAEGRQQPEQIVLQYIWREEVILTGQQFGRFDGERTALLCGGTIVLDQNGNLVHWSRKPGTRSLGKGKIAKEESDAGAARLAELLDVIAQRIRQGSIGEQLTSPLGILARVSPPFQLSREDGVVRFGRSPHFNLDHEHNDKIGGRQWQISS